jgi:UDP-N-acetyl-D-galactosamine dehydrogenase
MGRYVAQQLVKLMIRHGSPVKGAVITVLGFTFKEDVPDLRNTRVIDIIEELRDYGAEVQIHDPCAHAEEALEEYGITLTPAEALRPAQAVVLAVPHRQYLAEGWSLVTRCLDKGGVVVDVKAKLDRATCPDGVSLWRL